MFFTLDDYRKIEEYLRLNSKKDTDFPTTEEIHDEDYVPIIQDSTNKKMTVLDLRLGLSIGPRGESAYEVAVRHGYVGTEEDWLASLDGKSAYQIAVELGYVGTKEEWLASLRGEKGEDGKDGSSPILKLSDNGMDILASSDGGETWYKLVPDFNKLRVLGYVDSRNQLPKSANMGDIYGVWNPDVYSGRVDELGHLLRGAYDLYVNTVTGWDLDATITKVYSYDTELPSVAKEGSVAIVPVKDLTLDKEKIDGYKVYKYSIASDGWILILNTAEICNSKDDIVNKGDNIYALVQGNGYVTETKLKEETIVSKNDYCRISNMTDNALLLIIVQDSKRMFHSIGTGTYMIPNNCGIFLVNDHDLTDVVVATSMSDPEPKELSSLEYMPEGIYPYYILTENSAGDIYITPQSKLDPESPEKQEGLTIETKITTLLSFSQTYELYKRVVGWVYFGTNASITYHLVQNIEEGTETNVLSGKAVKDAFNELEEEVDTRLDNLERNTLALTLTVTPNKVFYKDIAENITITAALGDLDPDVLDIKKNGVKINEGTQKTVIYTEALAESANIFTANASYYDARFVQELLISSRYPVYTIFTTLDADLTTLVSSMTRESARVSAAGIYNFNNNTGALAYPYLLVPSDVVLPTEFSMGGTPVAYVTSSITLSGVSYTVYRLGSDAGYEAGVTLSITAS